MRLTNRLPLGPPGLTRLRNGLVRACLILAPHRNTYGFRDVVGEFDEPLFTSVCGSTTVTTPVLRLRCAVPVGHHVRVRTEDLGDRPALAGFVDRPVIVGVRPESIQDAAFVRTAWKHADPSVLARLDSLPR